MILKGKQTKPAPQSKKRAKKKFKKVFLHVGPDKTGSSAIQSVCDECRAELMEYGIYYLEGMDHAQFGSCFSRFPERYARNVESRHHYQGDKEEYGQWLKSRDQKYLAEVCKSLDSASARCVVFSYEGFPRMAPREMEKMKEFLSEYSDVIEVVYYARSPFSYATSTLSQHVRAGRIPKDWEIVLQPFQKHIAVLCKVFGRDCVNVRKFAREAFSGGSVVWDFFQLLGLPEEACVRLSSRIPFENQALSAQAIYVGNKLIESIGDRVPDYDFFPRFGDYLERLDGERLVLTVKDRICIANAAKNDLVYLKENYGITFDDSEINLASSTDSLNASVWQPLADLVVELLLRNVDLSIDLDFRNSGSPDCLINISGLSNNVSGGRWTDARLSPTATLKFRKALPKCFVLALEVGAFGPNVGKEVKVRIGKSEQRFVVTEQGKSQHFELEFNTVRSENIIEIIPPDPTAPCDLDATSKDARKLGIKLVGVRLYLSGAF